MNVNATTPDWLVNLCLNKGTSHHTPKEISNSVSFAKGSRNTRFTSLAGNMRKNGDDEESIYTALCAINATLQEPLPESEIRSIARSICRYDISPDGFNNDSFASLMAKEIEGKSLYCAGSGFQFFDNKRWSEDKESLYVLKKARELSDKICSDALLMRDQCTDPQQYSKLLSAAKKTKSASFMRQSIELLKADTSIHASLDDFDNDKNLINFQNGTYCLRTGQFYAHKHEDKLSHILDFDYDKNAKAPHFQKLLRDVLGVEKGDFFMRIIGYALLGRGHEQKFFIMYGSGKNGKSTLVQAIENVLNQLVITIQADSLSGLKDGQIRDDLARIPNKRIIFTNETRAGCKLDAALIKQLTGQDTMAARKLYKEFFQFVPIGVPMLVTNHLPVIDGSDFAIERRICLLTFDNIIENVDPILGSKLKNEKSGIFNIILEGLSDYQANGLSTPYSVMEKTKAFIEKRNVMKRFINERIEFSEYASARAEQLYNTYQTWSWQDDNKPFQRDRFKESFEKETGLNQLRDNQGRYWLGIKIKLH